MNDNSINVKEFKNSLAGLLDLDYVAVNFIGKSENIVFDYMDKYIVRASYTKHRDTDELHAEIEWISYLKNNGVNAAKAIEWNGCLIHEMCYKGEKFTIIVFEKVFGSSRITGRNLKDDKEIIYDWGKTLGKMHSITKAFIPENPLVVRKEWLNVFPSLDNQYLDIQVKLDAVIRSKLLYLKQLKKSKDNYGLIHCDLTLNNIFYKEGNYYIFDFDHSKYSWFIYDFAVVVDYVLKLNYVYKDKNTFINEFLYFFISGYEKTNHLNQYWMNQLPEFLKIWRLENLIAIVNKHNNYILDEWEKRLIKKIFQDVINDVPLM